MNLLAIDYGLSHIGLAISSSPLAEPYSQLSHKSTISLIRQLKNICQKESIDKIIVGISEGKMAAQTQKFINLLEKNFSIPIISYDETLSSHTAKKYLVQSGAKKSKRQNQDHQIAAAVILQAYLDEQGEKLL